MQRITSEKRNSGISLIGDLPWGTTICQFYQTKGDLLEVLVPYFKEGLESNESCLWVASALLDTDEAKNALRKAVPAFEEYEEKGQIELISQKQWNALGGKTGIPIISRLDQAISGGFDGLRLACNALPVKKGSDVFVSYGADQINGYDIIALFAYPRGRFDATGLMEVVKNHRFALVRNAGRWEVIESSGARVVRDALKRSEEKLHALFSNMSEGFAYHRIVLDSRGKPCDYIFLEVNRSFETLTGLPAKKIIGKKATEVLPGIEKDPADWIGKFGKVAVTRKPMQFESYSENLGKWYSVSAFSPHKGYFAVTFSDISERKKTESALLKAKREWERTFDSVPDLIAILDGRHRVVRVNKAMAERLGLEPAQCIGVKCYEAVHGSPGPIVSCPHTMSIADDREHVQEVHEPRLGGDFLVSTTPMHDETGRLLGCVHIARDITERKKAEEALRRAHEELQEHAARLEAANKELESFSYSVSHDLRSPLRAIVGFTRMILDEQGSSWDQETTRKFGIIQENAQKMGLLIDDLLRLSRLGRVELRRSVVDMERLAREVLEEIRIAEPGRKFDVKIHDLPPAHGDPTLVRQLLANLLSNAVKFTRHKEPAVIEIGCLTRPDGGVYYVRDNGIGFDMKYHGKLFGVFQRLVSEKQFEGTGVGLAIAHRIIQRHRGRIWAEGKLQEGAAFYFTLSEKKG